MLKIDLHTHSDLSPDGSITTQQYQQVIKSGRLDAIAVTDHDAIARAAELSETLGDKIIIGEEITTSEGEIIGLFLQKAVEPGQSAAQTAADIKAQGGLVYIPHPFETVRKGLSQAGMDAIADQIDIVEAYNGRAVFQNRGPQAAAWAKLHGKAICASSDAHGAKGLGTAYTTVDQFPTAENLLELLASAHLETARPPLKTLLYPKANRLKKRLRKSP